MAVLDSEVHEKTRDSGRYGCNGKPRPTDKTFYYAPDGRRLVWEGGKVFVGEVMLRQVYHVNTKDCRHDVSLTDPKCEGCQWRGSGEAHWATYRQMVQDQSALPTGT